MTLPLQMTQRELARQLEEAVAAVMEVIARKNDQILRLEQANAILRGLLRQKPSGEEHEF